MKRINVNRKLVQTFKLTKSFFNNKIKNDDMTITHKMHTVFEHKD